MNPITHFWSLCVEEQFYLFWPFVILGLRNRLQLLKTLILLLVLVCGLQLLFSIFASVAPYNTTGLFPRAYSLGIGGLGAFMNRDKKFMLHILESRWIEYLAFPVLIFFLATDFNLKFVVCPIISLYLVLKTSHKGFYILPFNNFLSNSKIVYIGSISYGIYLFHLPLGYYLTEYVLDPYIWTKINWSSFGKLKILENHSWLIKLPLFSILTFLLAHLSFKYVEKPILSLKDKWFKYR